MVIEEAFGVRYPKGHVGRLLQELGWTPPMPIRRAIQRWRTEAWPELLRRARRERRVLVLEDESGFYLLPGLVRTYAPEAQTPVIREVQTRDHLSVMDGMTPEGKVYTPARQESLNGLHTIEFLVHWALARLGPRAAGAAGSPRSGCRRSGPSHGGPRRRKRRRPAAGPPPRAGRPLRPSLTTS